MDVPAFIKSALVMRISVRTLVWPRVPGPAKRNNITTKLNIFFIIPLFNFMCNDNKFNRSNILFMVKFFKSYQHNFQTPSSFERIENEGELGTYHEPVSLLITD